MFELNNIYLAKRKEMEGMAVDFFTLPFFWIAIAVIAVIIEGCTTQLVSIWFALGAVVTAVIAVFTDNLIIQLAVFVIASIICLAVTRPLARRFKQKNSNVATNSDRYIGKIAEVIVDVNNDEALGQVKVEGSVWSAKSTTNEVLPVGTMVTVNKIEGVKMVVTPVSVTK